VSDPLLGTSLTKVLGGRTATAMRRGLGLETVEDLLRHYPRRYAQRGELTDLASLEEDEVVTVMAEVTEVTVRPMRNRRGSLLEARISDGRSTMTLTFFNQRWREGQLKPGVRGLFSGHVGRYRGQLQLAHPEFELLPDGVDADADAAHAYATEMLPIYPASASVSSWQVRKALDTVLPQLGELDDPIPDDVRAARGLCSLTDAYRRIHRPGTPADADSAVTRLRFEEAFVLQTLLARRRAEVAALPATRRVPETSLLRDAFDARLPFTLTAGQCDVSAAIDADLGRDHPMHRLLQGDVGSGKTVVALRAMLRVVDAGGQAALLAPTEVLAAQHHRSIVALLGPLADAGRLGAPDVSTRVALLTGSLRTAQRRRELLDIVTGEAGIVVGTHALIQDAVEFHDLALVVVDEQHRFGVEQRAALSAKSADGARPHVLVMTATPIPRTVAMTVFGDVDVSTLSELPAGRAPISTHVVVASEQPAHLARAWVRVREEVEAGRRVFVVCPRIGDDEDAPPEGDAPVGASVLALAASLADGPLGGVRIATLHGRMSGDDKDDIMRRFSDPSAPDAIDVLVSTTVIEVGVDVPIATMMVIMDADRFGISQLHQLRGRVGRGGLPGLCLLVTDAEHGTPARERLDAVASTTDGFELSALDLDLRREGDVLGSSQAGRRSSLRLLEVARHEDVIVDARGEAQRIIDVDPALASHPPLAAAVAALEAREQAEFLERA
jgi:ATP-dependent DNA helicase RecG